MKAMNRRMTRLITPMILTAGLFFGMAAEAARVQPIQNVENASIPYDLDMEIIKKAVIDGCANGNWVGRHIKDGHVQCTLYIRSHMAKVDIRFDENSYSITYNSSENLKYKAGRIHRNYNKWVQGLNGSIQITLFKASRQSENLTNALPNTDPALP